MSKSTRERVLGHLPEGVSQEQADEFLAALEEEFDSQGDPTVSDKTYTEDELNAKIAEALKPLEAEIAKFKAEEANSEVAAQVQAAKDEAAKEIEELQKKLDEKDLALQTASEEKDNAVKELEDVKTYLQSEVDAKEAEEAREQIAKERVEQVKAVAAFTEERLAENAERWAKMSDEEFAALIEDYKTMAPKKDTVPPSKTYLSASHEESSDKSSALTAVREILDAGYDLTRPIR